MGSLVGNTVPDAAGYSGKPLIEKLGVKPGANVAIINAPEHYDDLIGSWPIGASISHSTSLMASGRELDEVFSFMHYFSSTKFEFEKDFPELPGHLDKSGMLWVSWPKGSSQIPTDLNENIIREIGLANGLVDVKVAAIDADWSGLKFVYRLKDR